MACDSRYATVEQYARLFNIDTTLTAEETTRIENALDLTAGQIHIARSSVDACGCTLSAAATDALAKLNCMLAACEQNVACGARSGLSDTYRQTLLRTANDMLTAIVEGRLEVCQGETGTTFPALGWANIGYTEDTAAEIIIDAERRDG